MTYINGIDVGERVVCIDVPKIFGTVSYCESNGVKINWDDGLIGELIWNNGVAYNAYRLQVIRRMKDA